MTDTQDKKKLFEWQLKLIDLLESMEDDGVIIGCNDEITLYLNDERASVVADTDGVL